MQRLGTAPYLRSTYGLGITTGSRYRTHVAPPGCGSGIYNPQNRTDDQIHTIVSDEMGRVYRGQPSESTTVRRES